jgi:RNA polymerase sigma-70 factor (ECF subfamily)
LEDREIIELILDGQKEAYALIMRKYHHEVFRYVYNMVGEYALVEDLVQDIFIHVYTQLARYDATKAQFRTWLYRVSGNLILNFLQSSSKRQRNQEIEYLDALADEHPMAPSDEHGEQIEIIIAAMKRILSPKEMQMVSYHYFHDLSIQEIADILELSNKTVYKQMQNALDKVRKEVHHGQT